MMSELLMRLIDQDLSVIFYDMTTIGTHGITQEIDVLKASGMSNESGLPKLTLTVTVSSTQGDWLDDFQ